MKMWKSVALAVVVFGGQHGLAELLVLRPGGGSRTALLRFNDRNAQFLGDLQADTEGFYGATLGADGFIYATGNTLGYGRIFRFSAAGEPAGVIGGGNLRTPGNLKFGPDGHLYVIGSTWPEEPVQGQVLRYDGVSGAFLGVVIAEQPGGWLSDLGFGRDGALYVCDFGRGISRYDPATGAALGVFIPAGRGGLNSATAFAFGPDGHLYVCNRDSNAILKFNARSGAAMRAAVAPGRGGLRAPTGLAFGNGYMYVSSSENNRVLRYNARTGQFVDAFITAHPQVLRPRQLLFVRSENTRQRR